MTTAGFPNIEALIPHRNAMRLIDKVVAATPSSITVEARLDRSSQFMIDGVGVLTYVGLEMMAQAVCAFDGLQRAGAGHAPEIGLLLGCRRYAAHRSILPLDDRLLIAAALTFNDGEIAAFECVIDDANGERLAEGTVTVYRDPGDVLLRHQDGS